MAETFRTTRRIEFCETDAAGIAHFSVFFQLMEQAEHALLRHLGLSVMMEAEGGMISWPRVSASCDFDGAVRFEDLLEIQVTIERIGQRSVTYCFAFSAQGRSIARGKITAVCCRIEHGQPLRSIPIPEAVATLLRPYVLV